jgi:hypothetical protein
VKAFDARREDAVLLDLQGWIPRELAIEIRSLLRDQGFDARMNPEQDSPHAYMWIQESHDGRH